MTHRQRNGLPDKRLPDRLDRPSHALGSRGLERLHTLRQIIPLKHTVRDHEKDHLPLSTLDPDIQRRRNYSLGILHQHHLRIYLRIPAHQRLRTVLRTAVHHQNLVPILRIISLNERIQTPLYVLRLVEHRNDHRYKRTRMIRFRVGHYADPYATFSVRKSFPVKRET